MHRYFRVVSSAEDDAIFTLNVTVATGFSHYSPMCVICWTWNVGDNTTLSLPEACVPMAANASTTSHTYAHAGSYAVRFRLVCQTEENTTHTTLSDSVHVRVGDVVHAGRIASPTNNSFFAAGSTLILTPDLSPLLPPQQYNQVWRS